jgi:DNA-binding NarL/FixJ family response regulator
MTAGLDLVIVDDNHIVCETLEEMVKRFYTWGKIYSFTDPEKATAYCLNRELGVAIFIVDVFLGGMSGFYFLDALQGKFPTAHSDSIMITGNASDDVVNMCVASDVNHLLEKPVRPYALQLAVRSIAEKYLKFAKKLIHDSDFAQNDFHPMRPPCTKIILA